VQEQQSAEQLSSRKTIKDLKNSYKRGQLASCGGFSDFTGLFQTQIITTDVDKRKQF